MKKSTYCNKNNNKKLGVRIFSGLLALMMILSGFASIVANAAEPDTSTTAVDSSSDNTVTQSDNTVTQATIIKSISNGDKRDSKKSNTFRKNKRVKIQGSTKASKNSCFINWKSFRGATKYQFKVCVDKSFAKKYKPTTIKTNALQVELINMKKNVTYYAKVRAIHKNTKTKKNTYSRWSKVLVVERK